MKKSVIFFIALVYVVSIVVVALFGASIKGSSDPIVYVESILITDPTNNTLQNQKIKNKNTNEYYDYGFRINYVANLSFSVQATVKPDNCSFKSVNYVYDEQNTDYVIYQGENNVATITLSATAEAPILIQARAESTDGKKLSTEFAIYVL